MNPTFEVIGPGFLNQVPTLSTITYPQDPIENFSSIEISVLDPRIPKRERI